MAKYTVTRGSKRGTKIEQDYGKETEAQFSVGETKPQSMSLGGGKDDLSHSTSGSKAKYVK